MTKKDEIINNLDKWEWVGENSFQRIPDKPETVELKENETKEFEKALVEKIKKEYYAWKIRFLDKRSYILYFPLPSNPDLEELVILERKPSPTADPEKQVEKQEVKYYQFHLFSPESQEAIRNANLETEIKPIRQQPNVPRPQNDDIPYLWLGIGAIFVIILLVIYYLLSFFGK